MTQNEFLSEEERDKIVSSIKEAEKKTSGEIRLFIDSRCKVEVLERAAFIFAELGMHKTKERSGVLFYLAHSDKKFAILGDVGINSKVGNNFWDEIKGTMEGHFRRNEFAVGLSKGIQMAGQALQTHFPRSANDTNELPDNIVFGNK